MNLKVWIIRRTEKSEQWKKLEKGQWGNLEMSVNSSGKVLKLIQIGKSYFEKACWHCSIFF